MTNDKTAPDTYRSDVLNTANNLIHGERNKQYGTPAENFRVTAELWSTYLGIKVEPHDVTNLMALLKIARVKQGFTADNYIDAAGYIAISGELHHNSQ